jgi:hypothetical protein
MFKNSCQYNVFQEYGFRRNFDHYDGYCFSAEKDFQCLGIADVNPLLNSLCV